MVTGPRRHPACTGSGRARNGYRMAHRISTMPRTGGRRAVPLFGVRRERECAAWNFGRRTGSAPCRGWVDGLSAPPFGVRRERECVARHFGWRAGSTPDQHHAEGGDQRRSVRAGQGTGAARVRVVHRTGTMPRAAGRRPMAPSGPVLGSEQRAPLEMRNCGRAGRSGDRAGGPGGGARQVPVDSDLRRHFGARNCGRKTRQGFRVVGPSSGRAPAWPPQASAPDRSAARGADVAITRPDTGPKPF